MNKDRTSKIIIAFIIIQSLAGLVLAGMAFNMLINRDVALRASFRETVESYVKSISGIKVEPLKGEDGKTPPCYYEESKCQGRDGESIRGEKGDTVVGRDGKDGQNATPEQIAAAVDRHLTLNPPMNGKDGAQGEMGKAGPKAEFRCNPELSIFEYRYPGDEEWTNTGGTCNPQTGGNNAQ